MRGAGRVGVPFATTGVPEAGAAVTRAGGVPVGRGEVRMLEMMPMTWFVSFGEKKSRTTALGVERVTRIAAVCDAADVDGL